MYTVRLFEGFLLLSLHDYAIAVATHGLYKDMFSVLREKPPSEICVVDESRRRKQTDHPSLSAWFYHSNSGLLIEVEEDNDRIYSSTHLSFLSLSLYLSLFHYPSSHFPPLSFLSHPSSHPHSQGESIWWPRLLNSFFFFFFLCCQVSQPNLNMCVCPCFCVCMCVSMRLISSGLAALTWWVC